MELRASSPVLAAGFLDRAIGMYRQGFESDWRDAYPGVNLATLLWLRDPDGEEFKEIVALVRYANRRRLAGSPDYWDHAVALELAALDDDEDGSMGALSTCLTSSRETWELISTANNIALVRDELRGKGKDVEWLDVIVGELQRRAGDVAAEG